MYTQSITRSHRTAFFLAIDCSGSMAEPIHFRGGCKAKSEVVATIANELLFELIESSGRAAATACATTTTSPCWATTATTR